MTNRKIERVRCLALVAAGATCMPLSTSLHAQETEGSAEQPEEIVVDGVSTGARRAIQDQKNSSTLVTIVSSETLKNLPDQSIGEALSRLPGVSIGKDRGEAESIFVRGADSRLNAVTINGDRLPSPESTVAGISRGQRTVRVNTVPATLIDEIQVFKAVPPDLDADSIGGAVEIKTKSATQLDGTLVNARVRFGHNDLPDKNLASGEFTFGDRLNAAGTWGVMATYSWEENNRGVEGVTASWDEIDEVLDLGTDQDVDLGGDFFVIEDYDIIWRDLERTRQGANVTFDFQPSGNSIFKFGGFWSKFEDAELRRRLQLRPGASADFTTDTVFNEAGVAVSGSTDGGRVRKRVRPGVKIQQTWNAFIEGNTVFAGDTWTFDWRVSNTFADRELTRTRTRWEVRGSDIGERGDGVADWTFTNGDRDIVRWVQPDWGNDPNVLQFGDRGDYLQRRGDISEDEITSVKVDLTRKFELANDGNLDLKFGYKGRFNDRDQWNRLFEFDGDEDNPIFMAEALGANQRTPVQPFGLENGIWGDQSIMDEFFVSRPDNFIFDGENSNENYFVEEDINAAYLMGTLNTGPWTAILGVRYEDTETLIRAEDGAAKNSYDNFFPAVILRYQATDNIILRGAWTNSISRPDFFDLRPFFDEDFDWDAVDGEAELILDGGNPLLDPFESQNFDLSFEYYMETGGVFSAGLFYKVIENFEYVEELRETDIAISSLPAFLQDIANAEIAEARLTDPTIPADLDTLATFNFSRPVNGDDADLLGLELNYQQKFDNLPAPWDGFGVFANYTTIDGESDITGGISRDYIIGQFDDVTNLQVFYETESFSARVAYNRNGITYETLGLNIDDGDVVDSPLDDRARDVEESYDLAVQYEFGEFKLFFDVRNFTDEISARRFFGSGGTVKRFQELEAGGRSYILGLEWTME